MEEIMKLNRFTVSFEEQDMHFLKKYGFFKAARMVKKHYKKHRTPFIHDIYQLANELRIFRKDVFELSKNARKHYNLIMLRKKNGGLRYIHSPDTSLKNVQRRILKSILSNIKISPYATAYVTGKNLKLPKRVIFRLTVTSIRATIQSNLSTKVKHTHTM